MRCPKDGELWAYMDDELSPAIRSTVVQHLSGCARCRQRLAELERSSSLTREELAIVSAQGKGADVRLALEQTRIRAGMLVGETSEVSETSEVLRARENRRIEMKKRRKRSGLALAITLVLTVLIGMYSFTPSRVLARQLLSVFRVRKLAVIKVSPDESGIEELARTLEDNLFFREPEIVSDEPIVTVDTLEEARDLAGFDVRMPTSAYLPDTEALRIGVKGRTEYVLPITREGLSMVLELVDMDPDRLGDGWDEGTITIAVPAMVEIQTERLYIMQVWNPTVEYPAEIDPRVIGEAGLRILGLGQYAGAPHSVRYRRVSRDRNSWGARCAPSRTTKRWPRRESVALAAR